MGFKACIAGLICLGGGTLAYAAPTAYIPLGSGNAVIAVDAANGKIIKRYDGLETPHGLVATPDGEYLIAGSLKESRVPEGAPADTPNSKLYVVHPGHGHVMAEIPVSGWTHHQAITPDGKYVLSTHPTRGGISDLGTWAVARSLEAGPSPEHLVFSPDEKTPYLYVANDRAGTVSVVSVKEGKVKTTDTIGKRLHGLDIGDDGKTLFISSRSDDKLVALDTATGKRRLLTLSPEPYHLDKIPGTGKVYVSSSSKAPKIWVVDRNTLTLTDTIQLPAGEGHQIAVIK